MAAQRLGLGMFATRACMRTRTRTAALQLAVALVAAAAQVESISVDGAAAHAVAADAAFVRVVRDGRLVGGAADGQWVGTHTSQLSANVLSQFPPLGKGWLGGAPSVVNSSVLRYLVLDLGRRPRGLGPKRN